jgi:hypothetical protein
MNPRVKWISAIAFVFSSYVLFSSACNNHYHRNSSHADIPLSSIREGESLAEIYCQSCHLLPDPSLLDAKSWEKGVLPNMGPRLGIFSYGRLWYPSSMNDPNIGKGFYPSSPVLGQEQWRDLMNYYIATAPDSLAPQQRTAVILPNLPLFQAETPTMHYDNPATCFIQVDTSTTNRTLFICDAIRKNVVRLDNRLQPLDSIAVGGPVVDIHFQSSGMLACDIGRLNPNNGKFGKAQHIGYTNTGKMKRDSLALLDSLARPVQITPVDLNQDGLLDYLVCEFGNLKGALSWMENKGEGKFIRHIISPAPGAIKAYIQDYNHDGLPDFWVLFAQGEEGIFLYTNLGHGQFKEEEVLRFPPIYGSSYFELDDFNHDGFPDILYTCGDNADYSGVLKPYHGVYIFMNDGQNHFTQKYFFPIDGCYKAIARDFDGDGDLDIATIAFFGDYARQPEEGFVYLENKGNFQFQPYTLPEAQSGRWLTMDVADLDGDGKPDIILGNFSVGPSITKSRIDWRKGPPFLFLKNMRK